MSPTSRRYPVQSALAFVLCSGLGAPGCGVAQSESSSQRSEGADEARVVVGEVREGSLSDHWVFLGEVRPLAQAELAAGAAGEVRVVTVREGDRVEAGAMLLSVDPSLAKAALRAARASRTRSHEEHAQARRDRERAERLGQGVVPAAEIERDQSRADALDAERKSMRAAVSEAKARLGRHSVVAPFTGTVASRRVDPGDWIEPGDVVLELVDVERVEVLVNATPELAAHVREGGKAVLRRGDDQVEAEVRGVVRALDRETRTIKVRLWPSATQEWLLPGAAVDVGFDIELRGDGVVVPRDALVVGAVGTRVMKVVDATVASIEVEVVATAGPDALVRAKSLSPGDRVVTRGNERLRPGQAVTITE